MYKEKRIFNLVLIFQLLNTKNRSSEEFKNKIVVLRKRFLIHVKFEI